MSFYATIQGQLTYPDQESFDRVVTGLQNDGWLDQEGYFVDECGNRICDNEDAVPNIDRDNLAIEIPCCHYRNLSRADLFLNELSWEDQKAGKERPASRVQGTIVGTSTDGCFVGWIIENGVEITYDLEEWAAENLEGDDAVPPIEEECDNEDDYFQNLVDWQALVEQQFHSN